MLEGDEMSRTTLWHLAISHYSEKVRWALDYKGVEHERRAPMAGYHIAVALALTRGRHYTFPVLETDGERVGDSSAIIAALEARYPEPPLYPADPDERRRALELEDWFDEQLGPYMRRFAFHEMRRDRERFAQLAVREAPRTIARFKRMSASYARAFTALRFGAGSAGASERARERILAALDHLESELDSNEYLVGERFSVADLTAAALFYPLVLPPEGPRQYALPEAFARFRQPLTERHGFRWVEEMFHRHRRQGASRGHAEHVTATGPQSGFSSRSTAAR
jgi:glutathione S-transferase